MRTQEQGEHGNCAEASISSKGTAPQGQGTKTFNTVRETKTLRTISTEVLRNRVQELSGTYRGNSGVRQIL